MLSTICCAIIDSHRRCNVLNGISAREVIHISEPKLWSKQMYSAGLKGTVHLHPHFFLEAKSVHFAFHSPQTIEPNYERNSDYKLFRISSGMHVFFCLSFDSSIFPSCDLNLGSGRDFLTSWQRSFVSQ